MFELSICFKNLIFPVTQNLKMCVCVLKLPICGWLDNERWLQLLWSGLAMTVLATVKAIHNNNKSLCYLSYSFIINLPGCLQRARLLWEGGGNYTWCMDCVHWLQSGNLGTKMQTPKTYGFMYWWVFTIKVEGLKDCRSFMRRAGLWYTYQHSCLTPVSLISKFHPIYIHKHQSGAVEKLLAKAKRCSSYKASYLDKMNKALMRTSDLIQSGHNTHTLSYLE